MRLDKSLLAAGLLIVSGFSSGFLVSNGSGQVLGLKPVHSSHGGGVPSGTDEQVAAAIFNASAGDDAVEDPGRHPTLGASSGGTEAGGAPGGGPAAALAATAPGAGTVGGSGGSVGRPATATLSGTDAAALLAGNTVDVAPPHAAPHFIYYAARGLKAEGDKTRFSISRWVARSGSICEPGGDGAQVCRPMRITRDGGAVRAAGEIGRLELAGSRWAPIYAGNLLGVPDHIPSIDSAPDPAMRPTTKEKTKSNAEQALETLLGHVVEVVTAAASSDRPSNVLSYLPDGALLMVERPDGPLDPSGPATVRLGHWTFAKGVLCQSVGASSPAPDCAKPEVEGRGDIRLRSTQKSADVLLTIRTDSDSAEAQAAN